VKFPRDEQHVLVVERRPVLSGVLHVNRARKPILQDDRDDRDENAGRAQCDTEVLERDRMHGMPLIGLRTIISSERSRRSIIPCALRPSARNPRDDGRQRAPVANGARGQERRRRSVASLGCRGSVVSGGRRAGTRTRVPSVCVRQLRERLLARPDSVAPLRRAAVRFAHDHGAARRSMRRHRARGFRGADQQRPARVGRPRRCRRDGAACITRARRTGDCRLRSRQRSANTAGRAGPGRGVRVALTMRRARRTVGRSTRRPASRASQPVIRCCSAAA
jgi:hypothetical protein